MATLMLVAGNITSPLKDFLDGRGSLEVRYAYDSLYRNLSKIETDYIKVDKLVYVYNSEEGVNVRGELQTLQRLLIDDRFFNVKEVVFFISSEDESIEVKKLFKAVMSEVSERAEADPGILVPEATISSHESLTYDEVYNTLLGMTEANRQVNTFKGVYRVERSEDSNKAYEEDEDINVIIEPFRYDRVQNYKIVQESVYKTDSGELIVESEDRRKIEKVNATLGRLEYSDIRIKTKVLTISGNHKSGITTFSVALSVSLSSIGKKVLYLDLSKSRGSEYVLKTSNVYYNKLKMDEVLTKDMLKLEEGIALLNDFKYDIRIHALRFILSNMSKFGCDYLVVDCDVEDYIETVGLMEGALGDSFLLTPPYEPEVRLLSEIMSKCGKSDVLLSNSVQYQNHFKPMTPEEIKTTLPNLKRLIHPITFIDFDLDGYLCESLLEVHK